MIAKWPIWDLFSTLLVCWLYFLDGAERFNTEVCVYEEFPAGTHSYLNPGSIEIVYYLTHTRNYDPQQ